MSFPLATVLPVYMETKSETFSNERKGTNATKPRHFCLFLLWCKRDRLGENLCQCREDSVGVVGAYGEDAPRAWVSGTSKSEVATGTRKNVCGDSRELAGHLLGFLWSEWLHVFHIRPQLLENTGAKPSDRCTVQRRPCIQICA